METLHEYKCPCCGGIVEFDSTSGQMKCPYCDSEFSVESLKDVDQDLNKLTEEEQWAKIALVKRIAERVWK